MKQCQCFFIMTSNGHQPSVKWQGLIYFRNNSPNGILNPPGRRPTPESTVAHRLSPPPPTSLVRRDPETNYWKFRVFRSSSLLFSLVLLLFCFTNGRCCVATAALGSPFFNIQDRLSKVTKSIHVQNNRHLFSRSPFWDYIMVAP